MLTSTTGIKLNKHGFTIIELMVVMAIMAIMTGVVMVAMRPALRDAKMRSACRITASSLNYARSYAATTSMTTRVLFDQGRSVEVQVDQIVPTDNAQGGQTDSSDNMQVKNLTTAAGRRHIFPEGIEISRVIKADTDENENFVEFTKLGEAEEAIIELTDTEGQKRYVMVDSITGRCRVQTSEEIEQSQKIGSVGATQ